MSICNHETLNAAFGASALERGRWYQIPALKTGYIQAVDPERLLDFARRQNVVVCMERSIGDFVEKDSALASVSSNAADANCADREFDAALNGLYTIEHFRTIEQDPAFGIRQLVDIALRALSPGVNDQTTAIVCIDFIGAILAAVASQRIQDAYRSANGDVHVIAQGPTFKSLISEAFDPLRDAAGDNIEVYLRLLNVIETATQRTPSVHRRRILDTQIELIAKDAERTVRSDYNQGRIRHRLDEVRASLSAAS